MAGLPKFVLKKLRQESGSPARAPLASGSTPMAALTLHPDPDVLCSFYEQALPQQERRRVLEHLARCADCRKIVSFAFPLRVPDHPHAGAGERLWRRLLRAFMSPVLAWCAVCVMGVVVGFLMLSPERWSLLRHDNIPGTRQTPMARAVDSVAPLSGGPVSGLNERREQNAAELSSAASGDLRKSARTERPAERDGKKDRSTQDDKKETQSSARGRPPNERLAKQPSTVASLPATAAPMPLTPSEPPAAAVPLELKDAQTSVLDREPDHAAANKPLARGQLAYQKVEVPRRAALSLNSRPQGGAARSTSAKMETRNAISVGSSALFGRVGHDSSGSAAKAPVAAGAALWSITSPRNTLTSSGGAAGAPVPFFGRLQRSLDGGQSWQELHVDDGASFRALYVSGLSVWAGGSGGALYHSPNGGASWTRVAFSSGSRVSTDTIVEIGFSDSRHGKLKTDAGETWATSDGGSHWERRGY